jgi:hypothetical protein
MNPSPALVQRIWLGLGLLSFAAAGSALPEGPPDRNRPVEITLSTPEIYPSSLTEPSPVGMVDVNPPFLHWQRAYADPRQRRREKLSTLFYFRLARSETMQAPVFESGARRWSFYSPYRTLEPGTWYWQCGEASQSTPTAITWSKVFSFSISGREVVRKTPPYAVLEDGLRRNGHPRIECRSADVGHLLPEDPVLARDLLRLAEQALQAKLPATFMDFSKWDDPTVRKSGTTKNQKASYILDDFEQNKLMPVVRGFLLTGDRRYLDEALAASTMLIRGYAELKANNLEAGFVTDIYDRSINSLYDSLHGHLPAGKRAELQAAVATAGRASFETLLDAYEHIPYNEHRWQSFIRAAILKAMSLVGEEPAASEWMQYLYDLWNYKVPGAGRNDGGWFTGTGYFNASCQTLFVVPFLLSQHTGADFFDHPWYRNVGRFACYSTPPDHPSEGFGDKAGAYEATPVYDLVRNLRYLDPANPWNHRYVLSLAKIAGRSERTSAYLQSSTKWYELLLRRQHPAAAAALPTTYGKVTEQAAFFPDTGYVAMFTDLDDLESNAMVNFRSCPFGQNGHAHAAQNAFNLSWRGEKLFYRTGYYTSSNDPFSVPNYKHSRAHNTILADGIGTSMAHSGYGWMPRFLNGQRIAYCLGDASNAFTGEYGPYGEMLESRGIAVSRENGYGNPGVTRFRRHLVFLRPHTLLVYDELAAKSPVAWTFRLNAVDPITKVSDDSVAVRAASATATAKVYTLTGTQSLVTDQFFGGPAVDFQRKLSTTKDEWHADITTATKTARERLLTVVRINPGETDPTKPLGIVARTEGGMLTLTIDEWTISAELDPAKPSLLIVSDDKSSALLTGTAAESLSFAGQVFRPQQEGMTLLVEKSRGSPIVQQTGDRLPDAVVFSNGR